MESLIATSEAILMLFIVGTVGFLSTKKRILPENLIKTLSPWVIDIALPCLIFTNIINKFSHNLIPSWWLLPIYWIGFTIFSYILSSISSLIIRKEKRNIFKLSLFFQNGIFIPIAMLSGIYGQSSILLVYLYIFIIFYPAFFFNFYKFFLDTNACDIRTDKLVHPIFIATIAGIILKYFELNAFIPDMFLNSINIIGQTALPLLLIIIGGNIYIEMKKHNKTNLPDVFKFIFIKNIIFPLITLSVLYLIRLEKNISTIIFIQSAVPPVTALPLFVERAGGDTAFITQLLIYSFIFSIVSIPLMMSLFTYLFS